MFEPSAHVGEDAELYALGQLDANQRDRFERHVASCSECARRVGEAESTVLRLIEAGAPATAPGTLRPFSARRSSPAWRWTAAIAAAFVLGLIPWLVSLRSAEPPAGSQLAMTAMLGSHFAHSQFVADVPEAPEAKVIYGRSGGWIYVLAGASKEVISIVTVGNDAKTTVGALAPSTQTRAIFVPLSVRIDRVLLLENGRQVAHANVAFATPAPR